MVSVLDTHLFANDVDLFFASTDIYPKVTTPKSSLLLMSPGTTNNSSNFANEFSEENACSFKDNDFLSLSLSHVNSKEINDFDLSFVENQQPEANPIKEISRMSEEALLHMISFVDEAAKAEIQNCDLYTPLEFQSIMPLEITPDEDGLKIMFKETEYKPDKIEKKLAKMRLLRGHQESFAEHFCRFREFCNKGKEGWQMLELKDEENEKNAIEKEEKVAQRSKKCKKAEKMIRTKPLSKLLGWMARPRLSLQPSHM